MEPLFGDLIFFPTTPKSAWSSRFVAGVQFILGMGNCLEEYSHVTILTEDGENYSAEWPRVVKAPIDKSRIFEVWRFGDPSDTQRRRIIQEAKAHVGDWYAWTSLLTDGRLVIPHTEVCSQFAGMCYAAAGIPFSSEGQRILAPNVMLDRPDAFMVLRYYPEGYPHG